MNDLYNFIGRNPTEAFWFGVFVLSLAGILTGTLNVFFNFLTNIARAKTGKYPPPRPELICNGDCDCNKPCACCQNNCEVGCGCSSSVNTE